MAKLVVVARAGRCSAPATRTFSDVPLGSPLGAYVETIADRGIVTGYPCGGRRRAVRPASRAYFRPAGPTTRAQAAKIVDTARTTK